MKTNSKSKLTIKLLTVLLLLVVLSSCSEESVDTADVNTEEIAEILSGALAKDSQGMTAQMEASAEQSGEMDQEGDSTGGRSEQAESCGQEFSSSFELTSEENMAIAYDYSFEYFYAFSCNQFMIPDAADFSLTQSGEFIAPRYESSNTSSGGWTLGGLEISTTQYDFEGNYRRSGQHASKIGNQISYNFDLSIAFNDVRMNKGNYVISQGSGSFSISGDASTGESFSVNGSVDFLGDQQILLTINDDSYFVNIRTGDLQPVQ